LVRFQGTGRRTFQIRDSGLAEPGGQRLPSTGAEVSIGSTQCPLWVKQTFESAGRIGDWRQKRTFLLSVGDPAGNPGTLPAPTQTGN
jgi:hypothetical protein